MAGIAAGGGGEFASGAAVASVAAAGASPVASGGFAARTKAASVTVPRKTTSLVFNPGQAPGAAFEHEHAYKAAGAAKKQRHITSNAFRITNNILQFFQRHCEESRKKNREPGPGATIQAPSGRCVVSSRPWTSRFPLKETYNVVPRVDCAWVTGRLYRQQDREQVRRRNSHRYSFGYCGSNRRRLAFQHLRRCRRNRAEPLQPAGCGGGRGRFSDCLSRDSPCGLIP